MSMRTTDGVAVTLMNRVTADVADLLPMIERNIAGIDVSEVQIHGYGNWMGKGDSHGYMRIAYRLKAGTNIIIDASRQTARLQEVVAKHDDVISGNAARRLKPLQIDRNEARAIIACGGREALRRLGSSAMPELNIRLTRGRADEVTQIPMRVTSSGWTLTATGGRIIAYIHSGKQLWTNGSLLVTQREQMPHALIAGLAGRRLDDVVGGTMLEGHGVVIRKAWHVGGKIGMTFGREVIDIPEALGMIADATRRAAA